MSSADEGPPPSTPLDAVQRAARGRLRRTAGRTRSAPAFRRDGPSGDARDPTLVGAVLRLLVDDNGWGPALQSRRVDVEWRKLVGPEIAAHASPVSLDGGVLTVAADSTVWATQLRLLGPQLLQRLEDGLGERVVRRVVVTGPTGPSWRRGPLRVRGQGPRDTYG